jgi:arabinofuranosyltransferase
MGGRSDRLLLAIALGTFLFTALRSWGYLLDDSFIALRYARNLVEGQGLVFNPGERVEGYTSLALVLLAALLLEAGVDPVAGLAAGAAGAGAAVLLLAARLEGALAAGAAARLERERGGGGAPEAPRRAASSLPLSPPILLATSGFAYWSFRALETMLFAALLLAALDLARLEQRRGRWLGSGLVFALATLTRPEGALLFALQAAGLAAAERRATGSSAHLARHAANAALFALAAGGYVTWRAGYYGEVLPNTFYAKVTGGGEQLATGLRYLRDFSLASPLLAAALLFPLGLAWPRLRARLGDPAQALALWAVLVGYVAYVVAVGADFMPFHRFFVPALPLAAVLAASALRALASAGGAWRLAVPGLLALHALLGLRGDEPYRAFVAHRTTVVGERVGEWLGARLAPGDWIAVNTAGSLPYASRLPTIDMLGLTDAQIARRPVYVVSPGWAGHRRGWGEYVLGRRPRAILWYNSAGLAEPHYLSDHELADDPRFRFFYRMRVATLPEAGDPGRRAPIRRFLGFPFGFDPSGAGSIPDLGLRLAFRDGLASWTTFFEGPVRVVYFELDERDLGLWDEAWRLKGDPAGLAALAAREWARRPLEPGEEAARTAVAALCERAHASIERGEIAAARALLGEASARNGAARSPLPYQYAANLAVLAGELATALDAQKEALRLDPASALYRENLARLLAAPWGRSRRWSRSPDSSLRLRRAPLP